MNQDLFEILSSNLSLNLKNVSFLPVANKYADTAKPTIATISIMISTTINTMN